MTSGSVLARLRTSLRDPAMRVRVLALVGGKMIGLALVVAAMSIFLSPAVHADAGGPTATDERHQHGVDADRRVPRVRHAGRLRHARGRLRAIARIDQHPRRGHRRHLHLRRDVLGLGLCVHVRAGERLHRHHGFFLQGIAGYLRHDGRAAAGVLGVPVRVRRHVLDDHVRRHGGPLRLRRRHPLQHRRDRFHLSDRRPLGVGT